jgi:hypothetical protein
MILVWTLRQRGGVLRTVISFLDMFRDSRTCLWGRRIIDGGPRDNGFSISSVRTHVGLQLQSSIRHSFFRQGHSIVGFAVVSRSFRPPTCAFKEFNAVEEDGAMRRTG